MVQLPADTGDEETEPVEAAPDAANDAALAELQAAEQQQLRQIRGEADPLDDEAGRQKRQNVRVDVQLPIVLRMSGHESPARTRDVSATGIGFSTRLPVELEQRGEVTVDFRDWRFTKAFIVRFVKPILAGSQVGVQFEALSQEEREKLVKQVFDVQREQLQSKRRR